MQHDGWLAITELHFTDQNPNRGDVDAIMNSIRTYGYNDTLHVWWNKPNKQWRIKSMESFYTAGEFANGGRYESMFYNTVT